MTEAVLLVVKAEDETAPIAESVVETVVCVVVTELVFNEILVDFVVCCVIIAAVVRVVLLAAVKVRVDSGETEVWLVVVVSLEVPVL